MRVDPTATTFSQIHEQFKPGLFTNQTQHLRLTGDNLHTHNQLIPHGKGAAALQARLDKYSDATDALKQALANEYQSPELADTVFQNLNLTDRVQISDLGRIQSEAQHVQRLMQLQARLDQIPEPSARLAGPDDVPGEVAELAAGLHEQVTGYVQGCLDQGGEPDRQVMADMLNKGLADFTKDKRDALDDLGLRDRAMLMEIIDQFELGPLVSPQTRLVDTTVDGKPQKVEAPEPGYDRTAVFILADSAKRPQLVGAFDLHDKTSDYSQRKAAFLADLAADDTIRAALKKDRKDLTPQEKMACVQIALALESRAFGRPSADFVLDDTMFSIGGYNRDDQMLRMGTTAFARSSLPEILNVACHENLHHFQDQFSQEAQDPTSLSTDDDRFQARIFQFELDHYLNSRIDPTAYERQSIEQTPMDLGRSVSRTLTALGKELQAG